MTAVKELNRCEVFEPLYKLAVAQAKSMDWVSGDIPERVAFCLKLLSGQGAVPAQPLEIACQILDFANKLHCFADLIDNTNPWEIRSWAAVEVLVRNLIKVDVEKGIRCLELATLYQIRYWTKSPERFHGTPHEKNEYIRSLTSLLTKLHMLNLEFAQFDDWSIVID